MDCVLFYSMVLFLPFFFILWVLFLPVFPKSTYINCSFRYDDKYHLILALIDGKTKQRRETSSKKSIANFIEINGHVCHDLVENEVTRLHNSLLSERKEKWVSIFPNVIVWIIPWFYKNRREWATTRILRKIKG